MVFFGCDKTVVAKRLVFFDSEIAGFGVLGPGINFASIFE